MKIIFHDNGIGVRGTSLALYDYAFFCKKLFNVECSFLYRSNHFVNDKIAIDKFKNEFGENSITSYDSVNNLQHALNKIEHDVFFMIKSGKWDNIISKSKGVKNWIQAVAPTKVNEVYGDKFAFSSKWLSDLTGGKIPYVPRMINLPDIKEDLKTELNIPKDYIVIGRHGGHDTFDIPFAKKAVIDSLNKRKNIFFLFLGTDMFVEHERVIFLPKTTDLEYKTKFINTCDAHLHARELGESFGNSVAEFSIKNKPTITWKLSREINHIQQLGEKGIYYENYNDLLNILVNFEPIENDWNSFKEHTPEKVMQKFKEFYFKN